MLPLLARAVRRLRARGWKTRRQSFSLTALCVSTRALNQVRRLRRGTAGCDPVQSAVAQAGEAERRQLCQVRTFVAVACVLRICLPPTVSLTPHVL
jgi:hypothetical protein